MNVRPEERAFSGGEEKRREEKRREEKSTESKRLKETCLNRHIPNVLP